MKICVASRVPRIPVSGEDGRFSIQQASSILVSIPPSHEGAIQEAMKDLLADKVILEGDLRHGGSKTRASIMASRAIPIPRRPLSRLPCLNTKASEGRPGVCAGVHRMGNRWRN